jgi:hypothetical protein
LRKKVPSNIENGLHNSTAKPSLLFGSLTWKNAKDREKKEDQQIKLLRPLIGADSLHGDRIKSNWGGEGWGISLLCEDALSVLTSSGKIWCQHMRGYEVLLLLFLFSFLSSPCTADYTAQVLWQNNGVRDHRHHHRHHHHRH